jgi:hypothetical protein
VQSQVGLADAADAARLAALQAAVSHRLDGTRDLQGLRKQALLATARGAVHALHSGDGRVLWRAALNSGGAPLVALRVARVPHRKEEDIEVRTLCPSLLCLCRVTCPHWQLARGWQYVGCLSASGAFDSMLTFWKAHVTRWTKRAQSAHKACTEVDKAGKAASCMQVLALFSDALKATAVLFSAYTGRILKTEALPGPVTHVQEFGQSEEHTTQFLMASMRAPFASTVPAFVYPRSSRLPEGRPLHLWAADEASGTRCDTNTVPPI